MYITGIVGDREAKPKSWVLTSPGWPHRYSNNIRSTQTIQVPEGNTIHFAWTNFDTESSDYVQIKDGDGTDLTPKLSQYYEIGESELPPPVPATRTSCTSSSTPMEIRRGLAGDWSGMNSRYVQALKPHET